MKLFKRNKALVLEVKKKFYFICKLFYLGRLLVKFII